MSLHTARKNVVDLIESKDFYAQVRGNWESVKGTISTWFHEVKAFERDDTFAEAFGNRRMTMRWGELNLKYGSMRSWVGQEYSKVSKTTWNEAWTPESDLPRRITVTSTERKIKEIKEYKDYPLDVSMNGIVARMCPEAFEGGSENLKKYTDGLHDLSANLLKPGRDLTTQMFNKVADGDLYAFMPLSKPKDQVVGRQINELAKDLKTHQQKDFCKLAQYIRSRMTRIKLASEKDMGTNFTDMAPSNAVVPKFKYGISLFSKTEVDGNTVVKFVGEDEIARRKRMAMEFRHILTDDKVNEIVVAYRAHSNPHFPMFARWDAGEKVFKTFRIAQRGLDGYTLTDKGVLKAL